MSTIIEKIAKQIHREAMLEAKRRRCNVKLITDKMINRFSSELIKAVDDEFKFSKAKEIKHVKEPEKPKTSNDGWWTHNNINGK